MSTYSYVDTILHVAKTKIKMGSPDAYTSSSSAAGASTSSRCCGLGSREVNLVGCAPEPGACARHVVHLTVPSSRAALRPHSYRGKLGRGLAFRKIAPTFVANEKAPVFRRGLLNSSLTMSYFHTGTRTIIGAEAFHCPVRDGKEWDHLAMVIRLNRSPSRH